MSTQSNQFRISIWRRSVLFIAVAVMVISSYAAFTPTASAASFATSRDSYTYSGTAGSEGGSNEMDVTRANGDNAPAIIFVHGGGWRVDGGTFGTEFQQRAAARGYTSFRLDYTLGPNGINTQLNEIMGAIDYIRDNAAKYNIDKNRVAIWGDSAGGSLVVRAAATGKSGAAVAVGWSAPTNAFRDMFNSFESFMIGVDHGTCIDTSFTEILTDILPLFNDSLGQLTAIIVGIQNGEMPNPDSVIAFANSAMATADMAMDELPSTFDKLESSAGEWGITFKEGGSTSGESSSGDADSDTPSNAVPTVTPPVSEKELKNKLRTMTPEEREEVGKAAVYLAETSSNPNLSDEQRQMIRTMQLGMDDVIQASASNLQDESKNSDQETSDPSTINITDGINIQGDMVTKKLLECMQNFIDTSPALFASPRTPPMFLANAQSEYLVNPADARQMSDKLRSMGIRSEYLILPGDNHMGYDPRAEGPSFNFVSSILHPAP